jgi:hypothetical protein
MCAEVWVDLRTGPRAAYTMSFVGSYTNPNTTLVTTFQFSNPSSLITFMGAPLLGLQTYAIKEPSGENDGKLPSTMMEDKFSNGNVTDSTQRSTEGVDEPSG